MHIPVLLDEAIKYLAPQPGQKFIDATAGEGGHALAIWEKVAPGGRVLGIEWDGELYKQLELKCQNSPGRTPTAGRAKVKSGIVLVNDSYANLEKIAIENGFEEADGILFDLGLSSWHLEESGRGFSFRKDEPLDMRFNAGEIPNPKSQIPNPEGQACGAGKFSPFGRSLRQAPNHKFQTAGEIVNCASQEELERILHEYGEERFAKEIAAAITGERKKQHIVNTLQLVEIIEKALPVWGRRGRIHFATKTFQALRIAVNDELKNLEKGLEAGLAVLKSGGRLTVISFQGLEDKVIKKHFREAKREGLIKVLTPHAVKPSREEIENNRRARSAKLRAYLKIS